MSEWEICPRQKLVWECTKLPRRHAIGPDDNSILEEIEEFKGQKVRVTVEVIK